ncbi:MAG TPA: ornithine carbamoyltransferase [Polyangia bacterium]
MNNKRDFLSFWDLKDPEILALIHRAEELRFLRQIRSPHATRAGRVLAMIFEKASTRTRVSFEVAMFDLGGHAVVLGKNDSQVGRGEPVRDTARVLSGYCHAIMIRTFGQEVVEELAHYATIPVINGLTDLLHPCQLLADLQTVYAERSGAYSRRVSAAPTADVLSILRGAKYAWIGDGNNMANSWIEAAGILGLDLALACPEGFDPDLRILARARQTERARITITRDPREAVAGRHVISTDVFASMGQEAEAEQRRLAFAGFCVDAQLMAAAAPDAIALHCLPAHRGEEITDDVMEGPQSRVFQQAENRLHAQKALLEWVLA